MNELNYASLEASRKLKEAWIDIKTDILWIESGHSWFKWFLGDHETASDLFPHSDTIPAPSLTEILRELPAYLVRETEYCHLTITKYKSFYVCCYDGTGLVCENINPTDAAIELLIWAKGYTP